MTYEFDIDIIYVSHLDHGLALPIHGMTIGARLAPATSHAAFSSI
jgi:hypothetical protein